MKKIAVCPGSFDPITKGHLDIISRASKLFDEIIVLILPNLDKNSCFSLKERLKMVRRCIEPLPNVSADSYDGLLAEYVKEHKACAIVKGLRAVSDFEYEFQMALANQKLYGEAQTIFLTSKGENLFLSSSLVRQIGSLGGEIRPFIPPEIADEIIAALDKKRRK